MARQYTKAAFLARLRAKIEAGEPLLQACAGSGIISLASRETWKGSGGYILSQSTRSPLSNRTTSVIPWAYLRKRGTLT